MTGNVHKVQGNKFSAVRLTQVRIKENRNLACFVILLKVTILSNIFQSQLAYELEQVKFVHQQNYMNVRSLGKVTLSKPSALCRIGIHAKIHFRNSAKNYSQTKGSMNIFLHPTP